MSDDKKITSRDYLGIDYPRNLLIALNNGHEEELPDEITTDMCNGILYASTFLNEREQKFLKMRYVDRMSLDSIGKVFGFSVERARRMNYEMCRKLRHPTKYYYIRLGLQAAVKEICSNSSQGNYDKGYEDGYRQGLDDANNGVVKEGFSVNIHTLPVEVLCIQERTIKFLRDNGIETLGDIVRLEDENMRKIKNFTLYRRIIIAGALQRFGLIRDNVDWLLYYELWESRQKRQQNNKDKENNNA